MKLYLPANAACLEFRDAEDRRQITGYAAVFYDPDRPDETQYRIGPYLERIHADAFAEIANHDIRALVNHDPNLLLGRSTAGTLRLATDKIGLRYEIDYNPEDPDHQRTLQKITRGDLNGSSFAFTIDRDRITKQNGQTIRELLAVTVADIGPVTYPAYTGTVAEMRSDDPDHLADLERRLVADEITFGHYARIARYRARFAP